MTKSTIGQRGKAAEKAVEAVLKKWNNKTEFAYWRLPESRSARSFLAAQPGDMCYFCGDYAGIIEVKSTEHSKRIAKDKISQLAVLNKLELAGASSVILINHSVEDKWRVVLPTQLEMGVPSWDLSGFPLFDSAAEALLSTGYF
jgi:hypothetical protein